MRNGEGKERAWWAAKAPLAMLGAFMRPDASPAKPKCCPVGL